MYANIVAVYSLENNITTTIILYKFILHFKDLSHGGNSLYANCLDIGLIILKQSKLYLILLYALKRLFIPRNYTSHSHNLLESRYDDIYYMYLEIVSNFESGNTSDPNWR